MTLVDAVPGIRYEIVAITGPERGRISELGFNPGCEVTIYSKGFNEYKVVNCRGVKTGLGKNHLMNIIIAEIDDTRV